MAIIGEYLKEYAAGGGEVGYFDRAGKQVVEVYDAAGKVTYSGPPTLEHGDGGGGGDGDDGGAAAAAAAAAAASCDLDHGPDDHHSHPHPHTTAQAHTHTPFGSGAVVAKVGGGSAAAELSQQQQQPQLIHGTVVHCASRKDMHILEDHVVAVDSAGKIIFVCPQAEAQSKVAASGAALANAKTTRLLRGQLLMPGMVDAHIHAPQYAFTGTGYDMPLLDWLNTYTFPVESKFSDEEFAKQIYTKVVNRLVSNGTTTACYFGTIHRPATELLAGIVVESGQRAYVGKVCMDCNSPDYYIEGSAAESAADTEAFVKATLALGSSRVNPVITPRFVPTCSGELLGKLGGLAKQYDVPVQSHLSENLAEIEWVKSLFPDRKTYTDVYDHYGLLTNKTVMAHCIYLSDDEIETIKARGTGIAHCPTSNFNLTSGILNAVKLLDMGVKVGLGTDVSGGHSPSILTAARDAITASKVLCLQKENTEQLDYKDALFLATLGGSQALGLDAEIGNFEPGKCFDALVVDPSARDSNFDVFAADSVEDVVSKFVYLGDDRNIIKVFVDGELIHSK